MIIVKPSEKPGCVFIEQSEYREMRRSGKAPIEARDRARDIARSPSWYFSSEARHRGTRSSSEVITGRREDREKRRAKRGTGARDFAVMLCHAYSSKVNITAPHHPAALAFVSYGIVLIRVRVRCNITAPQSQRTTKS